jgi:hypothetical protein
MKTPPDLPTTWKPTPPRIAELDRLGAGIAELSAHLEAATARLLALDPGVRRPRRLEHGLSLLRRVAGVAR